MYCDGIQKLPEMLHPQLVKLHMLNNFLPYLSSGRVFEN